MARIFWVAVEHWNVFRTPVWEQELRAAHTLTFNKLPQRIKAILAMPATQQKKLIAERKRPSLATTPKKKKGKKKEEKKEKKD